MSTWVIILSYLLKSILKQDYDINDKIKWNGGVAYLLRIYSSL